MIVSCFESSFTGIEGDSRSQQERPPVDTLKEANAEFILINTLSN